MRLRATALVLGLWFAATPVFGVFCEMDCDPSPVTIACHDAASLPPGSSVRSAHHACDHDHTSRSPALLNVPARDAIGISVVGPGATLVHRAMADARVAIAILYAPPGPTDRRSPTSGGVLVLRI